MRFFDTIIRWDHQTFTWCMRRKHQELLTRSSRYISSTADGYLYVAVGIMLLVSGSETNRQPFTGLAIAFATERAIYWVMKNSFKRNRPPEALPGFQSFIIPSDKFSFPSGHTSGAFLMATVFSGLYPALAGALFLWAVSVASSRVLLGVHFPTDTLIGALLGHSIGLVTITSCLT